MIETIEAAGKLLALVIRESINVEGAKFVTAADNSLQLGIMHHKKGSLIKPHVHKNQKKTIEDIQEVLHIEQGKVEAAFYDDTGIKIKSIILNCGDTILLISGGHGFNILEDTRMLEIKQGPYSGIDDDKVRL